GGHCPRVGYGFDDCEHRLEFVGFLGELAKHTGLNLRGWAQGVRTAFVLELEGGTQGFVVYSVNSLSSLCAVKVCGRKRNGVLRPHSHSTPPKSGASACEGREPLLASETSVGRRVTRDGHVVTNWRTAREGNLAKLRDLGLRHVQANRLVTVHVVN